LINNFAGLRLQHQRFGRIDSIRGLAALTVAIFHCMHVFSVNGVDRIYSIPFYDLHDPEVAIARIFLGLFNGNAAVSLFFVISGFVLGRSLRRNSQAWPVVGASFLLKRVIRLYPPMAVALIVFFVVTLAGSMVAPSFIGAPAVKNLRNNLALVSPDLVWPTWSLFIELGVAPLFVTMALLTRRFGLSVQLALLALSVIWLFSSSPYLRGPWLAFPLRLYFFLFAAGAALTFAEALVSRIPVKCVPIILLGGFIALGFSKGLFETSSLWPLLLEGVGGAAIVATVAYHGSAPILRHLDAPIARWLGRISYSFYLYHPLVFLTVLPFAVELGAGNLPLAPVVSGAILSLITVPPTAALAYASYWSIEIPTIRGCASVDALFSARGRRARAKA
jgi:peptidoglycan/LPS O-acetylase OafA/YrhL